MPVPRFMVSLADSLRWFFLTVLGSILFGALRDGPMTAPAPGVFGHTRHGVLCFTGDDRPADIRQVREPGSYEGDGGSHSRHRE